MLENAAIGQLNNAVFLAEVKREGAGTADKEECCREPKYQVYLGVWEEPRAKDKEGDDNAYEIDQQPVA